MRNATDVPKSMAKTAALWAAILELFRTLEGQNYSDHQNGGYYHQIGCIRRQISQTTKTSNLPPE